VTLRKEVEEKKPEGVLGVDVNEKSLDLVVVKPDKVKFIKITERNMLEMDILGMGGVSRERRWERLSCWRNILEEASKRCAPQGFKDYSLHNL